MIVWKEAPYAAMAAEFTLTGCNQTEEASLPRGALLPPPPTPTPARPWSHPSPPATHPRNKCLHPTPRLPSVKDTQDLLREEE